MTFDLKHVYNFSFIWIIKVASPKFKTVALRLLPPDWLLRCLAVEEPPARKRPWLLTPVTPVTPGPGTGVPFHWHGPGFAEVIHGRKVTHHLHSDLLTSS